MDYLDEKIGQLKNAILRWQEAINAENTELNRDASIQRFEFSFELLWKTIKLYLQDREKIFCNSPRSCFREIKNIFSLSDDEIELCLQMANDRNLASHTYSEQMSDELFSKLNDYIGITKKILNKIEVEK